MGVVCTKERGEGRERGVEAGVVKEGSVFLFGVAELAIGEGDEAPTYGAGEGANGGGEPEGAMVGCFVMVELAIEV